MVIRKKFAEGLGVKRTEGHVSEVKKNTEGFIELLRLTDGRDIHGDFFIDCSGFQGLLIEQSLQAGYDDWSAYLPCNRAVTVQSVSAAQTTPYTLVTARDAGWTWRIPLQHRIGNGYVFCSRYVSDDEAAATLVSHVDTAILGEPRVIPFVTGIRKQSWVKNCVALGLAQGFLEPLESTAIHLVAKTLALFIRMFPTRDYRDVLVNEFNRRVRQDYEEIRDFLVLHYCTTQREDTAFWRDCKTMNIPDSLRDKLDFFRACGAIKPGVEDFFQASSWQMVLTGMNVLPEQYNPTVDALDSNKLVLSLAAGQKAIAQIAEQQPLHDDFINEYCAAPLL